MQYCQHIPEVFKIKMSSHFTYINITITENDHDNSVINQQKYNNSSYHKSDD